MSWRLGRLPLCFALAAQTEVAVPTLALVSFLPPNSGKIRSGSVVSHKIVLLSIGQNPRDLKRGQRTRSTAVLGHLDATTAILESKEKLA
jgi:hypothetical protein